MSNFVNYQVELIEANAGLIDQINKLLIGGEAKQVEKPKKKKVEKVEEQVKVVEKVEEQVKVVEEQVKAVQEGTSASDFKAAVKSAKKEHGEEFALDVIKTVTGKVEGTLGKTVKAVDPAYYDKVIVALIDGPKAVEEPEADDDFDDDDDGLGDDTPVVTADAVKTALKAYAKSVGRTEAKELMTAAGAKALSNVDDLDGKALADLFKKLT